MFNYVQIIIISPFFRIKKISLSHQSQMFLRSRMLKTFRENVHLDYSSDPPCKDSNAWFTAVPLKYLSDHGWIRYLWFFSIRLRFEGTLVNRTFFSLHYSWRSLKIMLTGPLMWPWIIIKLIVWHELALRMIFLSVKHAFILSQKTRIS